MAMVAKGSSHDAEAHLRITSGRLVVGMVVGTHATINQGHGVLWRSLHWFHLWVRDDFVEIATGLADGEHECLALGVRYAQRKEVGLGGVHVEGVSAVLESVVVIVRT